MTIKSTTGLGISPITITSSGEVLDINLRDDDIVAVSGVHGKF